MDVVVQGKTLTINIVNKERYLGYAYLVISMIPFAFYTTDSKIEFAFEIVLALALWWAALLALAEKEYCVINKEKNHIKVASNNLFSQKQLVHNLDDLLECKLDKAEEGKKDMRRIVFVFNDGIEIPLTNSYYADHKLMTGIIKKVDDFLD